MTQALDAKGKTLMRVAALFIVIVFITSAMAYAQPTLEQTTQDPLYVDLSKTFGFIMGQRFSLNRIKTEYPDLALYTQKAELEFKVSFGKSEQNINKALQEMLKEKYSEYLATMKKQLESSVSSQKLSRTTAVEFLSEVESRARGEIPSPILETLLTYQFMERPEEEFTRGYTKVFRTKGHPKAKGVDLQIRHPISWRPREGERPNIIQKFTSENGRGLEMVMLMVKDIGYTPSKQEINTLFSEHGLKEMLPDGAKLISAKPIVLDNHKGGMIIFEQTGQRLDITLTMRSLQFVTIRGSKMIFVQCMVTALPGKEAELKKRYSRFEPLFRAIANSFVIQEQYK